CVRGDSVAENQSKMFLVAAIVMGVLATVVAFAFINSTAAQDRRPKTRILVAAHDLRANATIDPDRDLKIQEIPADFASLARQCLDPDTRASYRGQRINRRILAS